MPGEDEKSKFEIWLEKFLNGINSENISEELKFLATAIVKKQKLEDVQNVSDDLKKFAKQIVFDDSNFLLVASSKSLGDDQNLKLASSSFEKLTSQAKLFELLANYDQYNRALTSTKSVNTIVFNQQARTYNSSHENDKIWTLQIRNEENEILTAIFKGGLMIDCLKDASKEEIEKRKDPTTNEDAKDLASEFKKLIEKNHYKITHNEKDFEMQIAAEEVSDILEGDDKAVKSAYLSDVAGTGAGDGACAGAGTGAGAVQRICDEFCQTKQRISYEYCQTKAVESASLSAVAGFGAGAGAGAGVGALVGATVGGILGSVVPGAGTLAGATGGALIGAKVGAFAGAGTGACTAFFTGWQYGSSYNKASGKLINREEVETKNNEFSPFHALIEGGKAGALAGAWAGAASSAGAVVGPVCAAHAAGAFAGKAVVAQLVGSSAARGVVGAVKGGSEGGIGGFFWGFGRGIVVGEGAWLGECGNVFHITESAGAQIGVTALGATFDVTKAKWQGEGNIALILTSSALSGVEIVAANEFSSAYYLESHYNKVYNEAGSDSFFQRELINPIQATADAVKHDFWHNNSEFFHKVEAEQNKIAIHLSQLDLSLKEELSKLGFVLDKKEHQELSSSDLVLRDSTLHNMFLQHKESLNNSHDVLATLGLLKKDDFKFADPHTAKEINHELSKIIKGFGQLNIIHNSLNTIFPPKINDDFQFSASGDVNIMSTKLNEMQKFLQESGFQDFVKTVGIGGVEISDIKETTNISNLKDHFDKLREAICDNFHKSYDSSNDSSKITTFEDLKKHYHYYVDEKAKAEAAVKAQAQAAAEAEAEQRAQDNADNDPGRVKITVENTLQISSTDVGGIKIITSSNSNEPFVYDKLYELPTKDGFKVYGLSSDGGKEISGLVIMKGNEVLGFERSVLGIGNRHVNCFIKNEDTNTWTSFSYITLGVDPSGIDKSNDDGVLLEQKFAQLLNSALNQEVASPDQGHLWTPGDNKLFPACFGENRLLTIFNQATEVPILTILNQATEVPSDCIEGVSCSSLVGIIRSNYE